MIQDSPKTYGQMRLQGTRAPHSVKQSPPLVTGTVITVTKVCVAPESKGCSRCSLTNVDSLHPRDNPSLCLSFHICKRGVVGTLTTPILQM